MPTYEYHCPYCARRVSIFFRSIGAVESDPACPRCGNRSLSRRMSRFWSRSGSRDADELTEPTSEYDGIPIYGDDPFGASYDGADMEMGSAEESEDIGAFAREARAMAAMMGEPLDDDFDTALRHIEQGADPDDVFGEMDERSPEPAADDA
jgi:putative FmdB family regulatory protein